MLGSKVLRIVTLNPPAPELIPNEGIVTRPFSAGTTRVPVPFGPGLVSPFRDPSIETTSGRAELTPVMLSEKSIAFPLQPPSLLQVMVVLVSLATLPVSEAGVLITTTNCVLAEALAVKPEVMGLAEATLAASRDANTRKYFNGFSESVTYGVIAHKSYPLTIRTVYDNRQVKTSRVSTFQRSKDWF